MTYPSGKRAFVVVGTVHPNQKQWRKKCATREEAESVQADWEADRVLLGSSRRARATTLSNEALRDAEAAWAVAQKKGIGSLLDAVLIAAGTDPNGSAAKPNAPASTVSAPAANKTYRELFDAFTVYHKERASKSQTDKVRQDATSFGEFIGWNTWLTDISSANITTWLNRRTKGASRKTFNNLLNNLSRVFSWACAPAQKILPENPALAIERFSPRVLAGGSRQILSAVTSAALMEYAEVNHPEWCWALSLMLFAGVRPGYFEGEIRKLAMAANHDGIERYISGGKLHISAETAKDRRPRTVTITPNLALWLERYTPAAGQFVLGTKETYAEIRKKFAIPHDALRHTAISAHVSTHESFALAAEEFGNSERIIRTHYFSRMTKADAVAFYAIVPKW